MVTESWIIDCIKVYKIAIDIMFIEKTMGNWSVELTTGGKKFRYDKNPERHIPERCTITISICEIRDDTKRKAQVDTN